MASFAVLALGAALWAVGSILEVLDPTLEGKLRWARTEYIGIVAIPPAWLIFALYYTHRDHWLGRPRKLALAVIQATTLAVVLTNEYHRLFWRSINLEWYGPRAVLRPEYGPWFWLHTCLSYAMLAGGAAALGWGLLRGPPLQRKQAAVVLAALALPWLANLAYISGADILPRADFTPAAFPVAALGLLWGRRRLSLLDIVPIAREAVIERMPDGVIVLDRQNRIVDVNPAALLVLGRPAGGVLGLPAGDVLAPLGCAELVSSAVAETRCEVTTTACSDQRTYDLLISPLYDKQGGPAGRLLVFRDVTERKVLEQRLLRAQRLEMAGQVAAQVAHDLNNLLGPLLTLPQLIKRSLPPEHQAVRYCDLLIAAARQVSEINRDLLALGRRGTADGQRCELNEVVREALAQLLLPPTVALELRLTGRELWVRGAPAQLSRVLHNLVVNALEAMSSCAHAHLTITTAEVELDEVSARRAGVPAGRYGQLAVTDTGIGIPPELHERIFEPFFSTKRTTQRRGTGLGLSIVQAIVRDYGGFVTVQSAPGAGATFSVYLPMVAACSPSALRS